MEYAIWSSIYAEFIVVQVLADWARFFVDASSLLDSINLVGADCALTCSVNLSAVGRQSPAKTFVVPLSRLAGGFYLANSLKINKIPSNTLNAVHGYKVEEFAKPFRANTGPIAQSLPFLAAGKRRGSLTAGAIDNSMAGIGAIEAISGDVVEVVTERGYINAIASSSNLPN